MNLIKVVDPCIVTKKDFIDANVDVCVRNALIVLLVRNNSINYVIQFSNDPNYAVVDLCYDYESFYL